MSGEKVELPDIVITYEPCNHYYVPKYDPSIIPSMAVSRCIICGYERWTSMEQIKEWEEHGLDGKQLMD